MKTAELFRLVWLNLTANRAKVILTSLGIVVGAATIVLVLAIGRGGQQDVAEQFKNLSAGAIDISYKQDSSSSSSFSMKGMPSMSVSFSTNVMAAPSSQGGSRPSMSGGSMGGGFMSGGFASSNMLDRLMGSNDEKIELSQDEADELKIFVPGINEATLSATGKSEVTGGILEDKTQYTIAGVQSSYANVSNLNLIMGEFITDEQSTNKERVCVLGYKTAEAIFGSAFAAYDSVIYIDGRSYVVNGVLQSMGSVTSGISPDDAIFIPYLTAKKYILGNDISPVITVVANDVKDVSTIMENAQSILQRTYPNANFTITDAGSKMQAASSSADTLAMLLTAVALIVFVVGGIGIMNVLFVSVQERTGEIGVLKAIGCTRKDILLEFLCEAGMISLIGGIAGVALSFALLPAVKAFGISAISSAEGCMLAILFAIITGTLFGFYPAFKASRLIPVQALRSGE